MTWVREWLRQDPTVHVYWLLPHRGTADYEREDVLADRDRVTLLEADHFMEGTDSEYVFTESGYTENQLRVIRERIYEELGYVDIVVDQLRQGREDLLKWLLLQSGHQADEPKPFDLIVNVHDLMLPFKYATDGYRDDYHRKLEVAHAVLADGCWFKAGLDATELPMFGREFLLETVIEDALDDAVMTESPIDFSRFEERYATEPRYLHIAGSGWQKKHPELLFDIAADLHREYGIETVFTSMDDIPESYTRYPWVEAYPRASWEEYERMLRKGDIAICATEYDTLARTWFEQAASGQVLVVRDEPWVEDCVPEDSPLVVPVEELGSRARWVVEHWDDAVAANRRLIDHVREVRSPERAGRKTLDDMTRRVDEKIDRYAEAYRKDGSRRSAVGRAIDRTDPDSIALDELNEAGATVTKDGTPLLSHEWCSITDLVFALRVRGYHDTGNAGAPVFRRASDPDSMEQI
ncbi:glycosyltransferase family 1 protein [Halogeometricum sp. S1BR25-6]|uniref:Glycosyltransferase family 1 protein n=1 Tax=Halogeometricum salsisoli TaxID=2950536 RepID=A0ABU2GIP4_9EURY|nr:glycosyltransferase family 1 protein [Halogeometricum sp. S1BR25-6]MDS0300691.1 glycosyltransferase family 1 protein [Halogeometricum sp. S1BR25-6]